MEKSSNGNGATASLDKRVAAALADTDITKNELIALVDEANAAIKAAEQTIQVESERELDLQNDDPDKSDELIRKSKRLVARFTKAIPELAKKIDKITAAEYSAKWHDAFDRIEAERDNLARELATLYPSFVQNIIDLFNRIDACDAKIGQLARAAPSTSYQSNEYRRLLEVELVARGLDSFDRFNPPIRENLKLPDPNNTCETIFPPQQNFSLMALNAMQPALRAMIQKDAVACSPDWAGAQKIEEQRIRAEAEKRDE